MKLTKEEAAEGLQCVKRLHELALKTGSKRLIRAAKAMHEEAKRYGKKHHGDVVQKGGDT